MWPNLTRKMSNFTEKYRKKNLKLDTQFWPKRQNFFHQMTIFNKKHHIAAKKKYLTPTRIYVFFTWNNNISPKKKPNSCHKNAHILQKMIISYQRAPNSYYEVPKPWPKIINFHWKGNLFSPKIFPTVAGNYTIVTKNIISAMNLQIDSRKTQISTNNT